MPTHEAIREQLRRMVGSATFAGAQRAIRLLTWVVEETLAGRAAGIKEYTVGAEGLGRGPRYEPRADATARVEAHRLRTRIELYYAREGAADTVRIDLPKGSYVPLFSPRQAPPPSTDAPPAPVVAKRRMHLGLAALGLIALAAGGVALHAMRSPDPSREAVTEQTEAQRLFSQGAYLMRKPTAAGLDGAIDYFRRAIVADPRYAPAYAKLANCYVLKSVEAGPSPLMAEAKELTERALALDEKLAEAHAMRAFVAWVHDLDRTLAEQEIARALALDPQSAEAHYTWARVLADTGRFDEALSHARQTSRNAPLSPDGRKRVPYVLYLAGRYDEAMVAYRDLIELEPDFIQTQRELGLVLQEEGLFDEALEQFRRVQGMPESYGPTMIEADVAQLHAFSGDHEQASRLLQQLLEKARRQYVSPYDIAVVYTGLGRRDEAFTWLERAADERPFWLSLIQVDPRLRSLRADPRYASLLGKLGLTG